MNFLDILVRELVRIVLKEIFKKLGNYIQLINCIISFLYSCDLFGVTGDQKFYLISSELH